MLLCAVTGLTLNAVPAYPRPIKLPMPDGKMLTIVGHGDEYRNYATTVDGYTIVRGEDKFYRYARIEGGELVATDIVAHEVGERTPAENTFLAKQEKYLQPLAETLCAPRLQTSDQVQKYFITNNDNYKGLVVLVNYNDRSFRMGNEAARAHVNDMMSAENWTSYEDDGKTYRVTGSVSDYFRDNTYGKFNPKFDVVGPVDINYSCTYPRGTSSMGNMLKAVINAIKNQVDFSQYDSDGNGEVDMIYFIFAGYPSSNVGNNTQYLWPHASSLAYYITGYYNNVRLGRYACSTELYGWEDRGDTEMNGIGTICHEFSHVLGYMDHYDTSSGGNENPGTWDVMAGGSYNGQYSSCPAGYNAYERYSGGFMTPTLLTKQNHEQTFTMPNLQENAEAYMIKTPVNKEYFLVENRQKVKWDNDLPGHGMLVWRVDSTSTNSWYGNKVNATSHSYFQLIRANGFSDESNNTQADAFPGSKKVTSITNDTKPASLLTFTKEPNDISITRIKEDNKEIQFTIIDNSRGRTLPEGIIFYESFDDCDGVGGNDEIWNTAQKAGTFSPDNDGWTYTTVAALNQCARFGSTSITRERVLSPTIKLEAGKTYTLAFKAAPYNTDGTALQLSINSGDATLLNPSDNANTEPSTSIVLNMQKNQWTEFRILMTGSGNQQLKFYGNTSSAKRFLLDEITVYDHEETAIEDIKDSNTGLNPFAPTFNLSGQRVSDSFRGIVIQNGKKYLVK